MGNYRFKLSDMMPNAWFYKLRDMNKSRNQLNSSTNPIKKKLPKPIQNPRKSYYHTTESIKSTADKLYGSPKNPKAFDTHFPHDPPRKSSKKRTKRKTVYKPSPRQIPRRVPSQFSTPAPGNPVCFRDYFDDSPTSPQHDFLESPLSELEYSDCYDVHRKTLDEGLASWSSSSSCKLSTSPTDIIIDMEKISYNSMKIESLAEFDMVSEPELPPIITRTSKLVNDPEKFPELKNSSTKSHTENRTNPKKNTRNATSPATRKSVSRSGRVKIRGGWSKLPSKKTETQGRKSGKNEKKGLFYSESFAIVKASFDPEQDFRDSMMEMIVENNIRASKDLEDLLACYLSLNSNEYHDLIIKAFEQIWFDMPQH